MGGCGWGKRKKKGLRSKPSGRKRNQQTGKAQPTSKTHTSTSFDPTDGGGYCHLDMLSWGFPFTCFSREASGALLGSWPHINEICIVERAVLGRILALANQRGRRQEMLRYVSAPLMHEFVFILWALVDSTRPVGLDQCGSVLGSCPSSSIGCLFSSSSTKRYVNGGGEYPSSSIGKEGRRYFSCQGEPRPRS